MNKNHLLSISGTRLGVIVAIAGVLLLTASTSHPQAARSTTHNDSGDSSVTFVSPKHGFTSSPTNPTLSAMSHGVDATTAANTPVTSREDSVNSPPNPDSAAAVPVPTPAQNDISVPTSEIYVPPANDDPELYTPPYPHYPCGSCRLMDNKTSPQMMCPQYMACTY